MRKAIQQFERDFLPLQPVMQRMAEHLLGDEQDAADVVQDCFVTLWNDREKMRKVINPESWCVTLVKRRCIDLLRRRRPAEDVESLVEQADDPYEENERQTVALRLLEQLPERQKQAIRLRHFDAADTQTIARTLNISEGNVYTLLSRAYTSLKQKILDYEKQ